MSQGSKVLITGASGFIGKYATPRMSSLHTVKTASLRNQNSFLDLVGGMDKVICLSGIAHQKKGTPATLYFEVNKNKVITLAKEAKDAGVRQFIYLSSVKIYGDNTGNYFDLSTDPKPTDPYGESKWEAEQALTSLNSEEFKVAIIRPPLVYGPEVKGNMQSLIQLVRKYKFLPFKEISNKRSMVYVGNLYQMLIQIIDQNASGTFIAGDKEAHSTSDLVQSIAKALKRNVILFPIPNILKGLLKRLKPAMFVRLFGDFIIDNSESNKKLNFVPPFSFKEGVESMCRNKGKKQK